ncbi:MAG TPA: MCP four helix bundle domain-containing protein, partial [Pirellula sp.]|nr:MCP four helix bundle domain-containing protein [Pirellula sp.]
MNDFKISTKLILLTSILSGFLLLTGWVGQSRLSTLNGNNESFSNDIIEKLVKVADIQRKLVDVIRTQKNAVLTSTESASNEFAASSETAAKELKKGVGALELSLTAPSAKDLSAKLIEQVDDFAAINKQCLDFRRQNTADSKAEAIAISLKSKETTDEILKLMDQVTAMLQNESK